MCAKPSKMRLHFATIISLMGYERVDIHLVQLNTLMRPGQAERRSHDYRRHGTTDLFAALNVKTGSVIGACTKRHRSQEFRAFLDQVEASVPADLDVHLVLDNASSHKTRLVHDWLVKRPRWHLHFTPTSASWLNLVEGWFSILTRRCLQRGTPRS